MRAALALLVLVGCSPSTPSPAQQATVATYTGRLGLCVADEKLHDAGPDAKLAFYAACAHQVDVDFGRADGGVQ